MIRGRFSIAKLPLAKDLGDCDGGFTDTLINAGFVRELATGTFSAEKRNVALLGGTGAGKSHPAIAIARAFAIGLEPMAPATTSATWSISSTASRPRPRPRPAAANKPAWLIT